MSCSARLPVYVMITAAFFPDNAGLVIFCLYVFGSIAAVVLGKLLNRTILKGKAAPFLLELPPYRWPTSRTTVNLLKFTSTTFLKRIGGVTALFAVMIWFLINFPRPEAGQETEGYQENSYIYQFGRVLEPVFEPLGFTVPMDVALVSGFVAKEVVVATMGVLFTGSSESSEESLVEQLRRQIPGQASAMAFLVFVLLYTPCLTTVVTLQKETKRWYWTTFSLVYQTAFAWGAAWVVYRLWALGFGH
jgi:ferrous iron transport protein B